MPSMGVQLLARRTGTGGGGGSFVGSGAGEDHLLRSLWCGRDHVEGGGGHLVNEVRCDRNRSRRGEVGLMS